MADRLSRPSWNHRIGRASRRRRRPARAAAPGPGRRLGTLVLAAAGLAALGLVGTQALRGRTGTVAGPARRTAAHRPEIERSITIEDVPADELHRRWRDPGTLRRIMAPLADIQPIGEDRTRWSARYGLGTWEMRLDEDRPGEILHWHAEGSGALIPEAAVRFRRASGDRGTAVTLSARLDPPGGMLGRAAAQMFGAAAPGALASAVLHRFKALVQTGEIPTTERQPAARRDSR